MVGFDALATFVDLSMEFSKETGFFEIFIFWRKPRLLVQWHGAAGPY
jgi:hypothetical protein